MFELYSEVRLKRNRPDLGLPVGIVGAVVEAYDEPTEGYFVDFEPPYDDDVYILGPKDLEPVLKSTESRTSGITSNRNTPLSLPSTNPPKPQSGISGSTRDDRL